jgi:hypothetical protein
VTTGFASVENFAGQGTDSLQLDNSANTATINAPNAGSLGTGETFSGFDTLLAGTAGDSFVFTGTGSLATVTGGAGTDSIDISAIGGANSINLQTGTIAGVVNSFSNVESFIGDNTSDGLVGTNGATTWTISAPNGGTLSTGQVFTNIPNLTGGTNNDTFSLAGGALSGSINGGGGSNSLAGSTTYTVTGGDSGTAAGVTGGFTNIGSLSGTAGADTFTLSGGTLSGSVNGLGGGDMLAGGTAYSITGADSGTVAGVTGGFTNIANLTGTAGNDTFTLGAAGSLSGTINGLGQATADTLDVTAKAGETVNLSGSTTSITAFTNIESIVGATTLAGGTAWSITGPNSGTVDGVAFSGVPNVAGTAGADTFTLAGGTLSGAINGVSGNDTLTGDNVPNTWTITGANSGTLTGTGGWSNIQNLVGGSSTDTFIFAAAGSVGGSIDGSAGIDTLNVSTKAGALTIDLQASTAPGIGTTFANIDLFVGSGANTTLVGPNAGATFTLSGADSGTVNAFSYSGVGNLIGGSGADTFTGSGGSLTGNLTDGGGATTLNGGISTAGTQSYTGAVTLGSATTATSTGNLAISFSSTVDGAQSLAVNTTAATTFGGAVGGGAQLTSLTTNAGGTSSSVGVRTSGSTTFNDNTTLSGTYNNAGFTAAGTTTLAGATTINAGAGVVTFTGAVTGPFALNVNSSALESFGSTINVASITTDAPGTVTLTGTVTTTGDQTFSDQVNAGAITLTAGGAVSATNAANDFAGAVTLNAVTASLVDANALAVSLNATGSTSLTAGTTLTTNGTSGSLATVSGAGTNFGALGVSGNLNVMSGGAVAQGGAMSVGGTTAINAGGNSVTLTLANDFGGAVSLTSGTTQITDVNTLTLGTLNTGALTVIDTGALNLGSGTVNGALVVTSNGGNITQTGGIAVTGTSNLAAGAGSITLTSSNDFGGAVTAGGTGGISLNDVNAFTPASINAGAGTVTLNAGAINGGGPLGASSLTLGSNSNVATVTFQPTLAGKNVLLTGSATSWTFCDFNGCGTSMTPPVFSKTSTGPVDIFFNGVNLGSSASTVSNVTGSIGATVSQIASQALQEALDTDSVQKQIDYGFAGDVGTTPPMDHRIDETGISTPECFEQSREGEPCK